MLNLLVNLDFESILIVKLIGLCKAFMKSFHENYTWAHLSKDEEWAPTAKHEKEET